MTALDRIERIESILTDKKISMEFPVEPGLECTIYANETGKHEIRLIRSFLQDIDDQTTTMFILDDYPLSEGDEDIQSAVLEILRRHLRMQYGLQPNFLWEQ